MQGLMDRNADGLRGNESLPRALMACSRWWPGAWLWAVPCCVLGLHCSICLSVRSLVCLSVRSWGARSPVRSAVKLPAEGSPCLGKLCVLDCTAAKLMCTEGLWLCCYPTFLAVASPSGSKLSIAVFVGRWCRQKSLFS